MTDADLDAAPPPPPPPPQPVPSDSAGAGLELGASASSMPGARRGGDKGAKRSRPSGSSSKSKRATKRARREGELGPAAKAEKRKRFKGKVRRLQTCGACGVVLQPSQCLTLIVCGGVMFNPGDPGRSQVCNREVPGRVDIQQGSHLRWLQRGVRIWTGAHTQCSALLQDDFKHLCKHFTEKILRKERHTLSFTSSVQTKLKKYLARFFNNMPEPVYERGFEGSSGPPPTVQ